MHDACISGIDTDKKFVSVEWIEGKDTKGKEVCVHLNLLKDFNNQFRLILINCLL